jgi:hypothetical protein
MLRRSLSIRTVISRVFHSIKKAIVVSDNLLICYYYRVPNPKLAIPIDCNVNTNVSYTVSCPYPVTRPYVTCLNAITYP